MKGKSNKDTFPKVSVSSYISDEKLDSLIADIGLKKAKETIDEHYLSKQLFDAVKVCITIAGYRLSDVEVVLANTRDILTITLQSSTHPLAPTRHIGRTITAKNGIDKFLWTGQSRINEITTASRQRNVPLPFRVKGNAITTYGDGILEVVFEREDLPEAVEIQVG